MRAFVLAVAVAALSWTAPSHAASLVGERGGWEIYRDDDSCFLTMEFEGPGDTEFTLAKFADGTLGASVTNTDWSATKGAEYDVSFVLNDVEFSGGKAKGVADGGRKGFVSLFNSSFERHFAAGDTLHIYLGDQRIDRLSLSGTAAALVLVNQCLGRVRATIAAAEREKARWADLPKDPFAAVKGAIPTAAHAATPRGNPGSWTTTNDYPAAALRENRTGTVTFRAIVGTDGRVSECEIASSSGHADLDGATCDNVRRRARFSPATDAAGNPVLGEYSNTVRWYFPGE